MSNSIPKVNILNNNHCEIITSDGSYFQSYNSVVALRRWDGSIILYNNYDYSRTTVKHLCQWLDITSKELHDNVKKGNYFVMATNL